MFNDPARMLDLSNYLYAAAALLTLVATFGVIYYGRLASKAKDAQLKQYQKDADARIAESNRIAEKAKSDAASANAEAERSRLERSKLELIIQQLKDRDKHRSLTPEQSGRLRELLQDAAPQSLIVAHSPNLESQGFSDQLSAIFQHAGWTLRPKPFRILERDAPGIKILVRDTNAPPSGAAILQSALKAIGIEAIGNSIPEMQPDDFELYVGPKQHEPLRSNE